MNEYISREAAFKEFAKFVSRSNNSDFVDAPTWNDAVSLIGSLPAADVVTWEQLRKAWDIATSDVAPVVRCRDCVYWERGGNEDESWEHCYWFGIDIDGNEFCSMGERKDGNLNG